MNYIDETLKFIESDEMREYLRTYFHGLQDEGEMAWLVNKCTEIVSKAPACIERKIPAFELIVEQTVKPSEGILRYNPMWLADFAHRALNEEQKGPVGTVYKVRENIYHEPGYYNDNTLYYTFNAALEYIKWIDVECGNKYSDDIRENANFYIEKFIPGDDGKMVYTFFWVCNHSGEIWYFGDGRSVLELFRDRYCDVFFDWLGRMNLPVPFEPGDIVLADCRPFSKQRPVLIITIGDNHDCDSVQCMYVLPNGNLYVGAVKQNDFSVSPEGSNVSLLYRASKYYGELSESEHSFIGLSVAIKKNHALGQEICDYIFKNAIGRGSGLSFEIIKENFGL